jgi:hypothetical protein
MKIQKPEGPSDYSIFAPGVTADRQLVDYRVVSRYGQFKFGSIAQNAKNLGISMKSENGGLTFTGPRNRLQMFAEKLHFALVDYR